MIDNLNLLEKYLSFIAFTWYDLIIIIFLFYNYGYE